MIGARARLHLAAALMPAALAVPWALWMTGGPMGRTLRSAVLFAGPAILAAQLAAWLRWGAIERRARNGGDGWPAGLGMAALTHGLFGLLLALVMLAETRTDDWTDTLSDSAIIGSLFALASLVLAGVPSFLLTAWLAQRLTVRRRKELNLESA